MNGYWNALPRMIMALSSMLIMAEAATANDRELFTYTDAAGLRGCFIRTSDQSWTEITGPGETNTFKEITRNLNLTELYDSSRGGVSVRLVNGQSYWMHSKLTKGEWHPLWRGSWTTTADLRSEFVRLGLQPRLQGQRGTCSVFTTVGAMEFGLSKRLNQSYPLSVEFLNWASNQSAGDRLDGSFFINCLNGFRKYGLCRETSLPYQQSYDPDLTVPDHVQKEGRTLRDKTKNAYHLHWILPLGDHPPGLTQGQLNEVKATLARGYPVAFGSQHSILLVGFADGASSPGGGKFYVRDSNHANFVEYSYEHVLKNANDVFWVDFDGKMP